MNIQKIKYISTKSYINFGSRLEDLYESIEYESQGDKITPLVTNPGRIMLTSHRLYFQPFNNVDRVSICFAFYIFYPVLRPNKKVSVFRVIGLNILDRLGKHIFFCFFFSWKKT